MQPGLYRKENEHDACGVGMLVSLKCDKTHSLVDNALTVLENMKHRGAEAADNMTGDGAGILIQIPHEFILLQGIPVPEKGKYAVGMVFLPKDKETGGRYLEAIKTEVEKAGLTQLHLRLLSKMIQFPTQYMRLKARKGVQLSSEAFLKRPDSQEQDADTR